MPRSERNKDPDQWRCQRAETELIRSNTRVTCSPSRSVDSSGPPLHGFCTSHSLLSLSYPHTGPPHSLSTRMTLILSISLLLFSGFVSASLYPTCPIAKTVYRGGTWNNITWIDSGESPPMDQLGKMSIHLWVDDIVSARATLNGATLYSRHAGSTNCLLILLFPSSSSLYYRWS